MVYIYPYTFTTFQQIQSKSNLISSEYFIFIPCENMSDSMPTQNKSLMYLLLRHTYYKGLTERIIWH